jgi:hypothetical protein
MRQEQANEEGSTNFQAGRDIVNNGLTTEQLNEFQKYVDGQVSVAVENVVNNQLETIRSDFVKFTGEANAQAMAIAHGMLASLLEQLARRAPQNIDSFRSFDMQHAVLNAATSAAVVGDDELTATLVDILVDKSGSEPRSFKGIVLSQALDVAGKLTADQVNLLTALLMIERTIDHNSNTVEGVLRLLDSRCRPLYGKLPSSNVALQYMAYTGVGYIERSIAAFNPHLSAAGSIVNTYDAVFTKGFTEEELSDELKQHIAHFPEADARLTRGVRKMRFPAASSQTLDLLARDGQLNPIYMPHHEEMKTIISQTKADGQGFLSIADTDNPELAEFIRQLDSIQASTFELSAVGVAVAQANWRRLLPADAPEVDMWLR